MAHPAPWRERIRLGRVVMLAPPNQGSALARLLDGPLLRAGLGPAAETLAEDRIDELPAPPCEFGIVAAGRGDGDGLNPLLSGDDDGIFSVDETRLEGAADMLVVPGLHTFLMNDREVADATARFLRSGRFTEAPDRDQGPADKP